MIKDIKIFKTESLTKELVEYGCTDFDIFTQTGKCDKNYDTYLNEDSIKLINEIYYKDFIMFNYEMILIN